MINMFINLSRCFSYVYYLVTFYKHFMYSYKTELKKRFVTHFFISSKPFYRNSIFPRRKNIIKYLNRKGKKGEFIIKCNNFKNKDIKNDERKLEKKFPFILKSKNNEWAEEGIDKKKMIICEEVKIESKSISEQERSKNIDKCEEKINSEEIKKAKVREIKKMNTGKCKEKKNIETDNKIKKIYENEESNFINNNGTSNFLKVKKKIMNEIKNEETDAYKEDNIKREERKKRKLEDDSVRKKLSELAKLRWQNEEERKKLLQGKKKFKHSEKTKKLLSYKIKLKWRDENYRNKILEKTRIFNQDENTKKRKSLLLKEKWKIREFRDKMLNNRKPFSLERRKKISEIIKQKWREEEYKKKTLKAIKDNYKKRKLEVGLNPNLNYVQNTMLFKQLGVNPPKIRYFPDIHKEKLKKRKKKKNKENYKENWKNIYDSILHKNEFQNSLTYLNKIENLSVSTNL